MSEGQTTNDSRQTIAMESNQQAAAKVRDDVISGMNTSKYQSTCQELAQQSYKCLEMNPNARANCQGDSVLSNKPLSFLIEN
jgi:hypothetical protein